LDRTVESAAMRAARSATPHAAVSISKAIEERSSMGMQRAKKSSAATKEPQLSPGFFDS